jgi:hypothetical protein
VDGDVLQLGKQVVYVFRDRGRVLARPLSLVILGGAGDETRAFA